MLKMESKIKVPIDSLKETSWSTIILFSVLYCINIAFLNFVVFRHNILQPVSKATFGLINETLVVNAASVIILVFIIIIMFGRLGFADIGFKKNRLLSAAAAVTVIWILMQLINIVIGLITAGKPVIINYWSTYGVAAMIGSSISQLFGNCLLEETAFRGFLLVQICRKFKDTKKSLVVGVVVSQLLFSLIHIPNRIMSGMSLLNILISLLVVFMIGVLFAAIYLLTDNVFLTIGIHAIWNSPLPIFDGIPGIPVIAIASVILLMIWDKSFGKLDSGKESSLSI